MRNFLLYEIKNIETGQVYVGSSGTSWMKRISEHLQLMKDGAHHCAALQALWCDYPSLTHWSFRIVEEEIRGSVAARHAEMTYLASQPVDKVLNTRKAKAVGWDQIQNVRTLRQEGKSLAEIKQITNIPISTASKIINNYPQYNNSEG